MEFTSDDIMAWLEQVKDPEIPVLSLVDLGVIGDVSTRPDGVEITLMPTFVGCPAIDVMKEEIAEVLKRQGVQNVVVQVSYDKPWTSDRISDKGRRAIKRFGLAPPLPVDVFNDLEVLEQVPCPRCDSTDTELRNPFGPTLCRSIHYCNNCREAFEQFKPL